MKILHLSTNYHPSVGGAQLLAQKLSEGFVARHGDDVTVLTTNALRSPHAADPELIPAGEERINGVLVQRFPFWRRTLPVMRRVLAAARRLKLPKREYLEPLRIGPISPSMFLATRRAQADVIGCLAFPFLQMYYPLGVRAPLVMIGALHLQGHHVPAPVLRAVARARAYIAFTEFEREALIRSGAAGERIHVVGLGVEVERFAKVDGRAIRERLGVGDAPLVGFIGRQARYKGCDTLVEAMALVWDRRPDAYLLLAGSRTEFSDELERMIAALPPHKRDRVLVVNDFTEAEKPQWFAACDVFVSTSSDESFGIVFLEAWACGVPVIGGRIPAVECVIREGEDGFLVPCREPAPLAERIERLLGDEALRARMGRSGLAKVRAEHDWAIVVDRVHAIYERVASSQT